MYHDFLCHPKENQLNRDTVPFNQINYKMHPTFLSVKMVFFKLCIVKSVKCDILNLTTKELITSLNLMTFPMQSPIPPEGFISTILFWEEKFLKWPQVWGIFFPF